MTTETKVRELFERFVERHVMRQELLSPEQLCGDHIELVESLRRCIDRYLRLDRTLDRGMGEAVEEGEPAPRGKPAAGEGSELPRFEGFDTIERLGGGGTGEVFKLRDRKLDRVVAGKVLRAGGRLRVSQFLREARAQALFGDERIVRVLEFREQANPPVLILEYVEGFRLDQVGRSLEYRQKARILLEVCEAIDRAHGLGLQHRDLKPANIMLDASLKPKILDFGLAGSDPGSGHFKGTPHYLAPEQLDPSLPIDARTDVYALGVILYELLCGVVPYDGGGLEGILESLARASPRLPVEVEPSVPEPLQAIALRAFERDAAARYPSAREMALDLRRFLDGRPVLARPTYYTSVLSKRLQPHREQIEEWRRLKLIYPHEAARLGAAYDRLQARDDDWIVESRTLSWSQIALYLAASLLGFGGILYFVMHRFHHSVQGLLGPLVVLGGSFAALNAAGHLLYRRNQKAVSVAFALSAVVLLPLLLMIGLHEIGVWNTPHPEGQLLATGDGVPVANRQLQAALLATAIWSFVLAMRTRTAALATVFTSTLVLLTVAVLGDLGLRAWLEDGRLDLLALHLAPLILAMGLLGYRLEVKRQPWFCRPLYMGAAMLFLIAAELLALDGRMFGYMGISTAPLAGVDSDPVLMDTLTAMSLNGILAYLLAWAMERFGSDLMRTSSYLLFVIAPFAILQPVGYLVKTGEYSRQFDWFYLTLALGITLLSRHRQRRSFYFAGLFNTAVALWMITDHSEWLDRPAWAIAVILTALLVFAAGSLLDRHERTGRPLG
ncbi:MAG: protein kinase [Acidobacteriota bacterium]